MLAHRLHLIGLLAAAASLVLSPPMLSGQDSPLRSVDDEGISVVRPGDQVQISMFTAAGERLNEVSGTRTVDRDGRLFLPYVGRVEVTGLDAAAIRDLLADRYADFYSNPVVDVETEIRVNVTGAVRQPGNYYLSPTSTIIDALATAGGTRSEVEFSGLGAAADPSRIRLVRRGDRARILDLRPEVADSAVVNLPVRSGDWVHVPPRSQSRWRSNLQLLSSFLSVVGSVAALAILIGS